jgi:very-long-chain enoyl-CoA reductase
MPARNIFKNCFHYWIFAGVNIACWIYRPDAPTAKPSNPLITYPALLLYCIGELGTSRHISPFVVYAALAVQKEESHKASGLGW